MAAFEGYQANGSPYQRRARKRPKEGRPVKAGPGYAERWRVEESFDWLGNVRRLPVRHECYLSAFRAYFSVTFILVSLRHLGVWSATIAP
jgi:hypothetical protein